MTAERQVNEETLGGQNGSSALESDGLFTRLGQWADSNGPTFAVVVGNIGLYFLFQVFGYAVSPDHKSLFRWFAGTLGVGVVLIVGAGAFWSDRRQREASVLRKQKSELQDQNVKLQSQVEQIQRTLREWWNGQMLGVAQDLGLTDHDRVSLYRHGAGHFILLGRYAQRPAFNGHGRGMYPDREGCIAKAWDHGVYCVQNLPDPEKHPDAYYAKLLSQYGIAKADAAKFHMKSRAFAAFAINNARTHQREAIIVIESVRCRGLKSKAELRQALADKLDQFSRYIDTFDPLTPSPEIAREEGF